MEVSMNSAVAKQTIKKCFQTLTDEQLQQYHLTHDYFTGRRLNANQLPRMSESDVDAAIQKKQRNLSCLNEVLYPTPTLGSVLGDALAALQRKPAVAESVASRAFEKPSEDLLNRVTRWFDQYQAEGLESLLSAQSRQLTEANIAVIKRAFSRNTILIQNACMLSEFWIRSPQDWNAAGDVGLFEHLFMQYEAPAFLKACWSQVVDEENIQWLLCFVLYAQGGSLKALAHHFGWTPVSSKLWHQLPACPANMPSLEAVLYAEFKRLGGWDEDFACLMANESYVIDLLKPTSEAGREFWYDTCRWTISKQFELLPEDNRKVLWWTRHCLTESARVGEVYSLQGRSLSKVLESITVYEQAQRQIQLARERMAERARQVSMAREEERERLREAFRIEEEARQALLAQRYQGYVGDYEVIDANWNAHGWDWSTIALRDHWRFTELTTSQALYDEGEAMGHCVGSYSLDCLNGESAIFSLVKDGKREVTIEINPRHRELVQVQGLYNSDSSAEVDAVVKAWMMRVVKR
jgi:hypothetical protein